MSLSLSCGLCQAPMLLLEQKLLQKQILGRRLSLTQRLVKKVGGEDSDYRPKGTCPNCFRHLTPAEIVLGFNRNPNDLTTKCPRCKHRFQAILVSYSSASRGEMPFYCPSQTLAMLTVEMTKVKFGEFKTTHAAIYRSAVYHFGSLKVAFKKVGLTYNDEPRINSWQKKVFTFLGKLPDTVIASNAHVSVMVVRRLRLEKKIPAYRKGDSPF